MGWGILLAWESKEMAFSFLLLEECLTGKGFHVE